MIKQIVIFIAIEIDYFILVHVMCSQWIENNAVIIGHPFTLTYFSILQKKERKSLCSISLSMWRQSLLLFD